MEIFNASTSRDATFCPRCGQLHLFRTNMRIRGASTPCERCKRAINAIDRGAQAADTLTARRNGHRPMDGRVVDLFQ